MSDFPCVAHHCTKLRQAGLPFCEECWPLVPQHFRDRIKSHIAPTQAVLIGAIDAIRWKRDMRARAANRETPNPAAAREIA
jgi:hypothetical protein